MDDIKLTTDDIIIEEDSKVENYFSDSAFKTFFASISKYPLLSKEENKNLALQAQQGDQRAREKVINSNLRLVVNIAYKYEQRIQHMQVLDIIQEGCLGLMKSVDKFDPERGSFITCAHIWIEQAITGAIRDKEKEIRLPVNFNEKRTQYIKLLNEYERLNKKLPNDEEICKQLKISAETLYNIRNTSSVMDSINREITDDSETEFENFIVVEDSTYDDILDSIEDKRTYVIAKEVLSPKLYYVFYYRCLSEQTKTLEELGMTLSLTKERIRQLERDALRKIKPYVDRNNPKHNTLINKINEKNINYEKYNISPITPDKIALYFYLKKHLSEEEITILNYRIFGKYLLPNNEVVFSKDEINKIMLSLNEKIAVVRQNPKEFQKYKKRFIKNYGADMYSLEKEKVFDSSNYALLTEKYGNLSFEEIADLIRQANIEISTKDEKLLSKYFKLPTSSYKYSHLIRKEMYLLEFQYKKKKKNIPLDKLWKTYQEHLIDFTDEQQLFLECFFFNKKPKKEFNEIYPGRYRSNIAGKIISRLERYYYKIYDLNENSFNKEKYMVVKKKYSDKLTPERIKLLNWFYGVNGPAKSITEIANILNEDYITVHGKVRHARNYCISLYNNTNNTLSIDLELYKKYILNNNCEFTEETRRILKMFVIDGYDYEKIDEITHLGKYRISNIITEGIRKIDFYRFGIIEAEEITIEDVKVICDFYKKHFNDLEVEIIIRRKVSKENPDEVATILNINKDTINRTIQKYNRFHVQYKIKDIELSEEEIEEEINRHSTDSVIDDLSKEILSVFYGFKTPFNKDGKVLSINEIKEEYNLSKSQLHAKYYAALDNIKARKINLLKPDNIYINRETLNNLLNDIHLPISEKEREIICHLLELKGYPLKTYEELSKNYGNSKGSIKRRYQRAIISMYKYLNNEIEGTLNYYVDIEPNLKYFSEYDIMFIQDFYKNNLTYEEIAKKYNYTFDVVVALMRRLKNNVFDLVNDKNASKFDFEYYRNNRLDSKLPYNGDVGLVTDWFELFTGENGKKRYSIPEIYEMYDRKYSTTKIHKSITNLMLSYCKLRDGICKDDILEFTEEDVLDYYNKNKKNMAPSDMKIYERYLNSNSDYKKINLSITGDLLMDKYPNLYDLNNLNRDDIFKYIKRYYTIISPSIKEYLMCKYNIREREFMSGKELIHIYKMLYNLDKALNLVDDFSMKRKLD